MKNEPPSSKADKSIGIDGATSHEDWLEQHLDEAIRQRALNLNRLPPHLQELRDRIRFLLVGYNLKGNQCGWKDGINAIRTIEKSLIVDPEELRQSFEVIRNAPKEERDQLSLSVSKFSRKGGHIGVTPVPKLERIRREGWAILAGIVLNNNKFYPLGSSHGLFQVPQTLRSMGDQEFRSYDIATMNSPDSVIPEQTMVNCRTSIVEQISSVLLSEQAGIKNIPENEEYVSPRRLGIGSALKYIFVRLGQEFKKEALTFNIATIYESESLQKGDRSVRVRNGASFEHNIRLFADEGGPRSPMARDSICNVGQNGIREFIGTAEWFMRGDSLTNASKNLTSETGAILTRGYTIDELEEYIQTIKIQLIEEQKRGQHVPILSV